ncbi:hypothetical protein [Paenimyroides baculatum]|uniref:DUF4369 domain-containing protein n=1 Tax=Paenimyroides baculatum TaxID=2608000 RepID=A0A5M6CPG7_9FLAO|nr:hypothetical protein [Paenimyroides baculatum]KAA5535872.1 hypothetical protein F0460_05390 [Paenimyroides baculatum]
MKIKTLLFSLILLPFLGNAQNTNLRKAILKSDLIVSINDYRMDTVRINDYTSKVFIHFDKIKKGNSWIYKNNLGSVTKKLSLWKLVDGEDFYSYLITDGGLCAGKVLEHGKVYSDLFFIKKEKSEYKIVLHFQSLEWEQLQKMEQQIKSLSSIEKIKNENERYTKTLDWFIENGLMPDNDFVDYYKEKQLIKDSIIYSESQYVKALQEFQNGKEELLPMLRSKYFNEVKTYYLQKMEDILKIDKPQWNDYYDFTNAFQSIINDELEYDSTDYLLYSSLTSDKFDEYDKRRIMKHLIEVFKDWELENN